MSKRHIDDEIEQCLKKRKEIEDKLKNLNARRGNMDKRVEYPKPVQGRYPRTEEIQAARTIASQNVVNTAPAGRSAQVTASASAFAENTNLAITSSFAKVVAMENNVANVNINPDLLEALGSLEKKNTDWGEPIDENIAMRLNPVLICGLRRMDMENLMNKLPFPKNLTLAKAPILNAEITTMLPRDLRVKDNPAYDRQNKLGAILSGITKAMSLLLHKEPNIFAVLSILTDTSKLLADAHYYQTVSRRTPFLRLVDKKNVDKLKDIKRGEFLFSANIEDLLNSRDVYESNQFDCIPSVRTSELSTRQQYKLNGHQSGSPPLPPQAAQRQPHASIGRRQPPTSQGRVRFSDDKLQHH